MIVPFEYHESLMREAMSQAALASLMHEVPIGAVVVQDGEIIGRGHNRPISTNDPSAHAEIIALREAAGVVGNYRLPNATLVVTLEPCTMCAGAIIHSRIKQLVFGARDPKTGACGSVTNILADERLNHHTQVVGEVLAVECGEQLRDFFRARR